MVKVRMVAATVAVVIGGLTATGAAVAGGPAATSGDRPGTKGKAAFCTRSDQMIENKQKAANRLGKVAAKIEARIASGDLSEAQKARAEKHLARVLALQAKLLNRVARLTAAVEKHCTA